MTAMSSTLGVSLANHREHRRRHRRRRRLSLHHLRVLAHCHAVALWHEGQERLSSKPSATGASCRATATNSSMDPPKMETSKNRSSGTVSVRRPSRASSTPGLVKPNRVDETARRILTVNGFSISQPRLKPDTFCRDHTNLRDRIDHALDNGRRGGHNPRWDRKGAR